MRQSTGKIAITGSVRIVARTPTTLRTTLRGRFDERLCDQYIAALDDWRGSRRRVVSFSDCTGITDYDVTARDKVSAWLRTTGPAFDGIHVLVEQLGPAWGLNIVAMVTGMKIFPYRSRDEFEASWEHHDAMARADAFTPPASR